MYHRITIILLLSFNFALAQRPAVQQESYSPRSYSRVQEPMANSTGLLAAGVPLLAVGIGCIAGAAVLGKRGSGDDLGPIFLGVGGGLLLIPGLVCTPIGIVLAVNHRKKRYAFNIKGNFNRLGLALNF